MTLAVVVVAGACTTLGPTPTSTMLPATPRGELDGAVAVGLAPGFYLSETTQPDPDATPLQYVGVTVEPGDLVPGLVVGVRVVGEHDSQLEPAIGLRRWLDRAQRLGLGVFCFGRVGARRGGRRLVSRAPGSG
jgi:hypothetical protein